MTLFYNGSLRKNKSDQFPYNSSQNPTNTTSNFFTQRHGTQSLVREISDIKAMEDFKVAKLEKINLVKFIESLTINISKL